MRRHLVLLILFVIFSLGVFFRFYKLTSVPPSLNWDEVAMGYNAYSILKTGKDEFGKSFPKYFRSLDDYKRPVYVYATVVSEAVFGENDFAVRFPAAFFGSLTILLAFFLIKELFHNTKIALLTAGVLSILPWHIQFSHAAFESTIGLFLTALGIYTFVLGVRKNRWLLVLSSVSLGLSLYSYLGQRGVVPILTVTLFALFWKKIFVIEKRKLLPVLVAVIVTFVFWVSLALDMRGPEGTIRFKATSIFTDNTEYKHNLEEIMYDGTQKINKPRQILHQPLLTSIELVTRGYLVHFSPDFFFFDLGQQHHHAPRMGIVYLWMLPFMILGLYFLVRKYRTRTTVILLTWLLATPIAASVTIQTPHALRVAEMIIPISLIIAVGLYESVWLLSKYQRKFIFPFIAVVSIVAMFFAFQYYHQYFIHLSPERSQDWTYGRAEMVRYVAAHEKDYNKIIASSKLEWPYIFFLYYTKYDPARYLAQGGTKSGSWDEEGNVYDNYEFHRFNYETDSKDGILYIGKPDEFPAGVKPLKIIQYLNGEPAIYIVKGGSK